MPSESEALLNLSHFRMKAFCSVLHSKKSITNHGDLFTSKLCIAFDNMRYVVYNNSSFMYYTAIQMMPILHDSGVLSVKF